MNRKLNHKKWSYHKKKLHCKRKNHRKSIFVPRIIVDTNVWYQLGKDDVLFNKVNAARKSKVDDNTARMQSIKQLGV